MKKVQIVDRLICKVELWLKVGDSELALEVSLHLWHLDDCIVKFDDKLILRISIQVYDNFEVDFGASTAADNGRLVALIIITKRVHHSQTNITRADRRCIVLGDLDGWRQSVSLQNGR